MHLVILLFNMTVDCGLYLDSFTIVTYIINGVSEIPYVHYYQYIKEEILMNLGFMN